MVLFLYLQIIFMSQKSFKLASLILPHIQIFITNNTHKQISWLVITTCLLSTLPESCVKRWIVGRTYIISHRILARSLSAVITIHNKEFRPKNGGVCVANHTTPVDVVILSTDKAYSLVSRKMGRRRHFSSYCLCLLVIALLIVSLLASWEYCRCCG